MKNLRMNAVTVGGNVSNVDIKQSTRNTGEMFGTISIAVDDGFFQKAQNGQGQDNWVERTHFVSIKVDHRFIQSIKGQISKGDQLSIQGKLVQEKWEDKQTGQKRSEMRIKAQKVVGHITKQELECLKNAGLRGSNQGQQNSAPQQGGFNQNQQQGGYQQ